MSLVAVIPARGGSKRVPGKNLRMCAGRPLLEWTCEAALGSSKLDRVLLSTDDAEIAAVGRAAGIEVPFLRPAHLSDDGAATLPVLLHVLDWLEENATPPEALVLLQPTSPLRTARHIDDAIDLFRRADAPSLVSVVETPHQFHPYKAMRLEAGALMAFLPQSDRAEPQPPLFARNGPAILVTRTEVLRGGELYGTPNLAYEMTPEVSIDIDTLYDFRLAEALLEDRLILDEAER